MSELESSDASKAARGVMAWFDQVPLPMLAGLALTLGLAPFQPEPHLLQKLRMLAHAELVKPLDMFDLCLHATPWLLLGLRLYRQLTRRHGA